MPFEAPPSESPPGAMPAEDAAQPLGRLRLLLALDALLVEGGVTPAARRLGLRAPAVSRLLTQLRALYGDPLLVRTGRGMRPTPLAERLRPRLRALADEAEALLAGDPVEAPPLTLAPALGFTRPNPFAGAPSPVAVARRLEAIGPEAGPRRRLARFIATTAAGPGRARPLTAAETEEAIAAILNGQAEPAQTGALLTALQQRGPTADELAGAAAALRADFGAAGFGAGPAHLDWPAYVSPRLPAPPLGLHAARLVASAGFRVLVHGGLLDDAAAAPPGFAPARDLADAAMRLRRDGFAWAPVRALSPKLDDLLRLYGSLGMRTPLNVAAALVNPLGAGAVALGGAEGPRSAVHLQALALLGGARGAALTAHRDTLQATAAVSSLFTLRDGQIEEGPAPRSTAPRAANGAGGRPAAMSATEYWRALWTGAARDAAAESVIVTTAAVALGLLTGAPRPRALEHARSLWRDRPR